MKKIFTLFAAMLLTVTALQAEVLLNEEVSFDDGWGIYRVLDLTKAPSLANVAKGDLLAITVTEADATSQLAIQGSNWQNLDFNSGLSFTTTGKQTVVFLTDSAVAKVKDSGIIVKGYNCTISKVELLYKKSLWEGELDATTNWAQTDPALDNTIFEDLKEGDLLGVTVSKINENNDGWHLYAFRANYRTNFISHDMSDTGVGIDVLSAADVDSLQNQTIILVASYLKVTDIHTYVAIKSVTPTAIDNANVNDKAVKFFKDGQLFIIRDDKTYTLQGQLVK